MRLGTYFRSWNEHKIDTYRGICETRVTLNRELPVYEIYKLDALISLITSLSKHTLSQKRS